MTIPKAKEMAEAIESIFSILNSKNIIQNYHVVRSISSDLKRNAERTKWAFSVDRGSPILFSQVVVDNLKVTPQITAECLQVDSAIEFPYIKWNIALEIFDEDHAPLSRWHFDLSNATQEGPKLHMQCGGRFGENRAHDMKLRVPRWLCPALDLVLLAETVTANFYPGVWENIKENRNWCSAIHQSQRLCFDKYNSKMTDAMNSRTSTMLNEMWGDRWG